MLTRQESQQILNKFAAFKKKDLRAAQKVWEKCKRSNISVASLYRALNAEQHHLILDLTKEREKHKLHEKRIRRMFPRCDECGNAMNVLPVNINNQTITGDNSKTVLMCSNPNCMETVYTEKTAKELIKNANTISNSI